MNIYPIRLSCYFLLKCNTWYHAVYLIVVIRIVFVPGVASVCLVSNSIFDGQVLEVKF